MSPHEVDGASVDRRPDAVSLDYLTAWSLGPVAVSNTSEGLVGFVWQVRFVDGEVLLSRKVGDVWGEEVVLFETELEVLELDLAFTQNADPTVCMEVAGEVWLYYFNPIAEDYVVENFGEGRNPRLLLDMPSPELVADSDILLFFMSDVEEALCYRMQRDRYATLYETPFDATVDDFLEDVVLGRERRFHVICSLRNQVSGRYSLYTRTSAIEPLIGDTELVTISMSLMEMQVLLAVIASEMDEAVDMSYELLSLTMLVAVHLIVPEAELVSLTFSLEGVELILGVLEPLVQEEDVSLSFDVESLELIFTQIVAQGDEFEPVGLDLSLESLVLELE